MENQNKHYILKKLEEYKKLVTKQQKLLEDISIYTECGIANAEVCDEFARTNEKLYLELKSLLYEIRDNENKVRTEAWGTTDEFPAEISEIKAGVWQLFLPPFFSVQNRKRYALEGSHIYYLIINMLKRYEAEYGKVPLLDHPVVFFRHHICTNRDRVFDFDNIDSKKALDAMQGFFLNDDNALTLTMIHRAVKDQEGSFCEILIFEEGNIPALLEDDE